MLKFHIIYLFQGVIFSVVFDLYSHLICSTSDDRTVRLWKVFDSENSENSNINWQTATVVLMKTMYAHTARVWRAVIRNDIVITIGEVRFELCENYKLPLCQFSIIPGFIHVHMVILW